MVWQFSFSNARVGYKGRAQFAISGVDITLESGDIFGLVGQSGSGKSTIIKTILGLIKPLSGKITLTQDGVEKSILERVGYSPQENALYFSLTLEENCHTFARLYGVKSKEYLQQKQQLLSMLKLEPFEKKVIAQLSGGTQKRADLAVALIHDPQVIILDEPFNGLDASLQDFIWKFIKKLSADGKIIIITSHLLDDMQKNCTKIGLVHKNQYFTPESMQKILRQAKMKLSDYAKVIFA